MKKPHAPALRDYLRACADGRTVEQIAPVIGASARTTRKVLYRMPDVYIDRWLKEPGNRGQYQAVWCIVTPPPHCPYPTERFLEPPKTRWATGVPVLQH